MRRAIWLLLACCCAAAPATAGETAAPLSSGAAPASVTCPHVTAIPGMVTVSPGQPIALYGVFDGLKGNQLTITTKAGVKMTIDAGPALKSQETTVLVPHEILSILGARGADGTIHADVIRRAKGMPTTPCIPPG